MLDDPDCDPEFDAWRWEDLHALPDLIVPFKREVYLAVVDAFSHLPQEITQQSTGAQTDRR